MDNKHKILLIGPQGSGKGTQAELLSKKLDIPALGMGQLLRDEIAKGSDIGKEAEKIIKDGHLVSDEMAASVLKKRLEEVKEGNGYILDGYPRNIQQYNAFDFDVPTHVIVIDVPRDESFKRLGGRLTCKKCGKVFAETNGFKVGDLCSCKGELYRRDDDTPEAISLRLDIYRNETEPMLNRFKAKGIVYHVNGVGSILEIHERILNALSIDTTP